MRNYARASRLLVLVFSTTFLAIICSTPAHSAHQDSVLLVSPKASASETEVNQALGQLGVTGQDISIVTTGPPKVLLVRITKVPLSSAYSQLRQSSAIAGVQYNYYVLSCGKGKPPSSATQAASSSSASMAARKLVAPNDPYFPSQWHLPVVKAVPAWSILKYKKLANHFQNPVYVAVLDTGCNTSNPDLIFKIHPGFDATGQGGTSDWSGHGTMVATTLAATADNKKLTVGAAPNAIVYTVKISKPSYSSQAGSLRPAAPVSAIIKAIAHCKSKGIRLIVLPYNTAGVALQDPWRNSVLHIILKDYYFNGNGITFLAAGAEGQKVEMLQPGPFQLAGAEPPEKHVLVVGSSEKGVDQYGRYRRESFSNHPVDIGAPGKHIICSDSHSNVVPAVGTSFSTAIVGGVAAMIWAASPDLTNKQIVSILLSNSRVGTDPKALYQLLETSIRVPNAQKAVLQALKTPPDEQQQ